MIVACNCHLGARAFFILYLTASVLAVCPSYTHKTTVEKASSLLPKGYCAFSVSGAGGLYVSPLSPYGHRLVPNTRSEHPRSIQISNDGTWFVYLNNLDGKVYVIRIDGEGKTEIKLKNQPDGSAKGTKTVGFVRHSPKGNEIFYLYNEYELLGLTLDLKASGAVVTAERKLAGFKPSDNMKFDWGDGVRIEVCRDRIFCQMKPIGRNEFITIPNNGLGIAGLSNLFTWANDNKEMLWGCGHALSPNGDLAVANSSQVGSAECVPNGKNGFDHKGFYITPFLRNGVNPPMTVHEQIDRYGVSINWAPPQYRFGTWDEVNFDFWSFAPNNSDYVIGSHFGSQSPIKALWVIHWSTNTWHLINSIPTGGDFKSPALFFGDLATALLPIDTIAVDTGTTGPANPRGYRVVSPNGSETFETGQTMTITVSAQQSGNADLKLLLGDHELRVPGVTQSFDPWPTKIFSFAIPEQFAANVWNSQTNAFESIQIPAASNACRIRIFDYHDNTIYDESDSDFTIVASSAAHPFFSPARTPDGFRSRLQVGYLLPKESALEHFDCTGRRLTTGAKATKGARFGISIARQRP